MERLISPLLVSLLIIIFMFSSLISKVATTTTTTTELINITTTSHEIKRDESSLLAFKSHITSDPHNLLKKTIGPL